MWRTPRMTANPRSFSSGRGTGRQRRQRLRDNQRKLTDGEQRERQPQRLANQPNRRPAQSNSGPAGLNSFTCVVSKVLVGHNFTQPDFAWRPTGELFLAKTNAITTGVISVSDAYQNAGGNC